MKPIDRRSFVKNISLASAATAAAGASSAAAAETGVLERKHAFQLKYAPHAGHFQPVAGNDIIDQMKYAADRGFRAWEDNGAPGRDKALLDKMGRTLSALGMEMGVFVASMNFNDPTFASKDQGVREAVLNDIRNSVDIAKRLNARFMTVVCGTVNHRLDRGYQNVLAIELLKQCAAILEPHGLVMVLEPLNPLNHPDLFLVHTPHAYEICRAVGSPSCKILFDIYHQQTSEGNLIWNIDQAWDEIAYFQAGDVPGRKEPGTGEIHYRNVFRHIHSKNPELIIGMEHGVSKKGAEGVDALVRGYVDADGF